MNQTPEGPQSPIAAELADASTDPRRLAEIAGSQPELWPQIRHHPSCYPELLRWIDAQSAQGAPAPPTPTSEEWAARFLHLNGREPTMSEFQTALESGEIASDRQRDQSLQQMSAGARQIATGAKDFYNTRVAPVVERTGERVAPTARAATAAIPGGWLAKAPLALPITAFIALISLFLPVTTRNGRAKNFFADELSGEGVFLLVLLIATIVLSVFALATRQRKLRLAAGIVGVIVGLIGVLDCFIVMAAVVNGAAVGVGAITMLLASVVIIASGVAMIVLLRRESSAGGQAPAS